jgi:beta-mannosidase
MHKIEIYLINDDISKKQNPMTIKMNLYKWDLFRVVNTHEWPCNDAKPNTAYMVTEFDVDKYLNDNSYNIYEYMAEFVLIRDDTKEIIARNYAFPGNFKDVRSISDPKPQLKIGNNKCDNGNHRISLEVKVEKPAIFMHISLKHDKIKKYRLSKNGFMQFEPIQVVQVTFKNPDCLQVVDVADFTTKTLNTFLL